jgi:glucosamine 6-phosphate synthetase-like amidotransferase/phosphosugar isomerase protein
MSDEMQKRLDAETLKDLNSLVDVLNYVQHNGLIENQIKYASKLFLTRNNWKSIGSGANYNAAKYGAKHIIKDLNRACAFDVLENHKHIDMSAESAILVFISGIWKHGYQEDALSEIKKMLAHNSLPIIITDANDHRFDKFSVLIADASGQMKELGVPVIKLPKVSPKLLYPLNVVILDRITTELKVIRDSKEIDFLQKSALVSIDKEMSDANLWK